MTESLPLPATEGVDPRYREMDAWKPETALRALWESQLAAVAAVGPALPALAAAAVAAADKLRHGGRLVYVGAGTSGRIAIQDGAELPPTFDWPRDRLILLMAGGPGALIGAVENAEDDAQAGIAAGDAAAIGPGDVVIGVAASGNTPFTCACLERAAALGATTIAVSSNPRGRLIAAAAHGIFVDSGAEPVAGSTRMKAGTAQKIVLNLLSTQIMLTLGRVHDGQMVDMRASNDKLRARAVRMLRTLTGADEANARAALAAAQGHVKLAVLLERGLAVPAANDLLLRHGGNLRAALASLRPRSESPPVP